MRIGNRDEVNAITAEWCAEQRVADVVERAAAVGLPAAPIRTYAEAAQDPHVIARDMLQSVRQSDGSEVPLTGPAGKFSRTPTRVRSAAPDTGQDDAEILSELGLSEAEITVLKESGSLRT